MTAYSRLRPIAPCQSCQNMTMTEADPRETDANLADTAPIST